MSLSSLLLQTSKNDGKKQKAIDSDLDALFRSSAIAFQKTATPKSIPSPGGVEKKRKTDEKSLSHTEGSKRKRVRASSEIKEWDAQVKKLADGSPKHVPNVVEDSGSDVEGGSSKLVHESLGQAGTHRGKRSGPQTKYVPTDESPEQRDARTIFVGNLAVEVAQKRPLLKQLQRHILAQIPSAKIESTRFRSVPFQNPTSKLPTSGDEGGSSPIKSSNNQPQAKQPRPHDRDRTSSWREQQTEDDGGKSDDKKFLNDKQKKKIAFINQEFHSTADTVNAYIVFAHPFPADQRPPNLPPLPPIMDPYDAASLAVEKCDGTVFMERMIRVDAVTNNLQSGEKTREKDSATSGDPKLSVFVGNLDFGSKEEDLRAFFEGVVSAERGPPSGGEEEEEEEVIAKRPKTWVTRVRIIRDKETQLGKGFAYVQFVDRQCVDEVLALEETKLKFAKRKLRVQRCKTLSGGSSLSKSRHHETDTPSSSRQKSTPGFIPVVPKGDPSLGEKLAHLPKDVRKEYKSSDADRVARRLAKKKARLALAKGGVKTQVGDRDRVRKGPTSVKKGSGSGSRKETKPKGRVRSEKSLAKRNSKK